MKSNLTVQCLLVVGSLVLSTAAAMASDVSTIIVVPKNEQSKLGSGDLNGDGVVTYWDDQLYFLGVYAGTRTTTYQDILRGDANMNGRFDGDDLTKISDAVSGYIKLPLAKYRPGDVNNDGVVTTADAYLLNYYLQNKRAPTGSVKGLDDIMVYNADCNRDGLINNLDFVAIYVVAIDPSKRCKSD